MGTLCFVILNGLRLYGRVELYIALKNDGYDKLKEVSQKAERLVKLKKIAKH